jgi:hypothetical protein
MPSQSIVTDVGVREWVIIVQLSELNAQVNCIDYINDKRFGKRESAGVKTGASIGPTRRSQLSMNYANQAGIAP